MGPWPGGCRKGERPDGTPVGVFSLLPVHQHEVVLQKRALGVGPHHTHQAASMELLVLVKGMSQLVHSLTGEEGKRESKKDQS